MKAVATSRREQIRWMLADLKMPGALEAVDGILSKADGGSVTAAEAIQELLGAQIGLRNNRRLQAAMRSSRLPAVKTLEEFDFSFQPSIKREQIDSLAELSFLERKENVVLLGPHSRTADEEGQCLLEKNFTKLVGSPASCARSRNRCPAGGSQTALP